MGTFQGALQILQSIVAEMQGQQAIGTVAGKQLSVILNQVRPGSESFFVQKNAVLDTATVLSYDQVIYRFVG